MNSDTVFTRPVKAALFGFLSLMGVAMGIAIARETGLIEAPVAKRALGLIIGITIVITGNLLPKLRPFGSPRGNHSRAALVERFTGWGLVLTGVAYVALFVFAPLNQAGTVS